jgi:hypothetical protein
MSGGGGRKAMQHHRLRPAPPPARRRVQWETVALWLLGLGAVLASLYLAAGAMRVPWLRLAVCMVGFVAFCALLSLWVAHREDDQP